MQSSSQSRHMYNKGKQFENQFFIYEPKCKKNMSNPGERKFQGSKTSSQSRHMYNKGKLKNNCQFYIYGPQYTKNVHVWLFGGPWVAHRKSCFPSYPLTYTNLHIKYGSNRIRTMKCLRTRTRRNDD